MPYTINKTNGGYLTTISDGNLDDSTSLTLIGKNYPGYGEILNENFVKLLENFSNSSAPAKALPGQLWWDSATKTLKVNTALDQWKIISGSTASSTEPANKTIGDLWFDTLAAQLKIWNGSTWTLIGPSYSSGTGTSGAVVDSIFDSGNTSHVVVKFLIGGNTDLNTVAMISKDAAFQPQTTINGFPWIYPGLTVSSTVTDAGLYGLASNADKLDNLNSTQFMRTDANTGTSGTVAVTNDGGVTVGVDGDLRLSISDKDAYIANGTSDGDMFFRINKAGVATDAMYIDGATGEVRIPGTTPAINNNSTRLATTAYVDAQAAAAASTSGFTTGTTMLFLQASAPTGWTKSTTHDNKAIRIVNGSSGGSTGGSVAFTAAFNSQSVTGTVGYSTVSGTTDGHVLDVTQIPSHTHFVATNIAGTSGTLASTNSVDSAYTGYGTGNNDYVLRGNTGGPNVGLSSATGSSAAHSHNFVNQGNHNHTFTGTAINLAVAYVDAIIAVKN